jgi:hypothetical protein
VGLLAAFLPNIEPPRFRIIAQQEAEAIAD